MRGNRSSACVKAAKVQSSASAAHASLVAAAARVDELQSSLASGDQQHVQLLLHEVADALQAVSADLLAMPQLAVAMQRMLSDDSDPGAQGASDEGDGDVTAFGGSDDTKALKAQVQRWV